MVLVILSITPMINAFQNEPIRKFSDIADAIMIIPAFITNVNKPKDKRIIGNEKNDSTGLSDTLSTPMMAATNIAVPNPLISAPLNTFTPINNATAFTTHFINKSLIYLHIC